MKKLFVSTIVTSCAFLLPMQAIAGVAAATDPCTDKVVTPQSSSKSATVTAGMISSRIANVSSGFISSGGATNSPTLNVAAPSTCGATTPAPSLGLGETETHTEKTVPGDMARSSSSAHGIWSSASTNMVKKTDPNGYYSGDIHNVVVGYDTRLTPDLIGGIAFGYEIVDIRTHYNTGKVDASAWTVAPYLGYQINDWLMADAAVGRTSVNYKHRRSTTIEGKTSAVRWFASTNLSATQKVDNFILTGTLGYLALNEEQEAYTETNNATVDKQLTNFGQARATLKAAYPIKTETSIFIPNGFVRFEYDANHEEGTTLAGNVVSTTDPTGVVLGLGADYIVNNNVTLNVTGTTTQLRENLKSHGISATMRFNF